MNGLLGKKIGMTQIFSKDGACIPITVVLVGPCVVVQKKSIKSDGYNAVQIGFGEIDFKKLNRALKGHFQKKKTKAFSWLKEFRVAQIDDYDLGQVLTASSFKEGDMVDVTGVSKGKGFQGVIKRHHKAGGPKTHGSRFHRSTGSIGQRTYPGKVFKNMKLPGHMGDDQVTVKNLKVVEVRPEENLIFIHGAVPGGANAKIIIRSLSNDFSERFKNKVISEPVIQGSGDDQHKIE